MIYFIARTSGDKGSITVIDLDECVSYERDHFDSVNDIDFHCHFDAIKYARELAGKFNLAYKPFHSRYDDSISEKQELLL